MDLGQDLNRVTSNGTAVYNPYARELDTQKSLGRRKSRRKSSLGQESIVPSVDFNAEKQAQSMESSRTSEYNNHNNSNEYNRFSQAYSQASQDYQGQDQSPDGMPAQRTQTFEGQRTSSQREPNDVTRKTSLLSLISRKRSSTEKSVKEPENITPEEETRRLLDTIKEEDTRSDSDSLVMDVRQEAESLTPATDPKVQQRRKGYRANLERHRNINQYTRRSKVVGGVRSAFLKFVRFSLLSRLFLTWLPLAAILFIPLAIDAFGSRQLHLGQIRVMWLFIWLEIGWGALFISRFVAHYTPEIVGFFVAIFAPKFLFVIDAFVALEWPLTLVLWMLVAMITFSPVVSRTHPDVPYLRWMEIVQNLLVAFLVTSLIVFAEQVLIYALSVSYHKTRMALRIKRSKRAMNCVTVLLGASLQEFPLLSPEFEEEDTILTSTVAAQTSGYKRKLQKFVDTSKVINNVHKVLGDTVHGISNFRKGMKLTDAQTSPTKIVKNSFLNRVTTETLAKRIWASLVMEDSEVLVFDDILSAIGHDRRDECTYIFEILDVKGTGEISQDDMVDAMINMRKETKNITKSLRDIDTVITKLHHVLLFLILIIVIVIFVGMLSPSAATVLATLGSTILGLSFIFAATCQEILASCIFLFVKHPIDIGDIVFVNVDGLGRRKLVVLEISLLYTVFTDAIDNQTRQAPNAMLNTIFIDNVTRSGPQGILLELVLGLPDTTFDQIEELRRRVRKFVDERPHDYIPDPYIQITDQPDLDRVVLTVIVTMRNSQEDAILWGMRRTRLIEYVGNCVHEIPLHVPRREDNTHTDPSLPLHVVTLDNSHAVTEVPRAPLGMPNTQQEDDSGVSSAVRRNGRVERRVQHFRE